MFAILNKTVFDFNCIQILILPEMQIGLSIRAATIYARVIKLKRDIYNINR